MLCVQGPWILQTWPWAQHVADSRVFVYGSRARLQARLLLAAALACGVAALAAMVFAHETGRVRNIWSLVLAAEIETLVHYT